MYELFGGHRVVDFSQGMAGPLATMVLADAGAEVIKVEPPDGDWARALPGFRMWNRGKRSVVLDLTTGAGRRVAGDLVRAADIVVEDFASEVAVMLGFDRPSLAADNPRLITCSIRAFRDAAGSDETRCYDELVTAKTGRLNGLDALSGASSRVEEGRPVFVAAPISAYGAAMLAVEAISAACLDRERTGLGSAVATTLSDGTSASTMRLRLQRSGDQVVTDHGSQDALVHEGVKLTFMTAECRDGRFIQMCARQDHHFRAWLSAMGLDHVLADARFEKAPMGFQRIEDVRDLEAMIRARMAERTQAEWMDLFVNHYDVGADPFLTPPEFLEHPQMVLNDRVVTISDPHVGPVKQVGKLAEFSATPLRPVRPSPDLGSDQKSLGEWSAAAGRTTAAPHSITSAHLPLEGITVVEAAYFLAGPFGTTLLAELGARVIKIEPPTGDPWRRVGVQVVQYVKGKESVAVDLKSPEGQQIAHKIIAKADAFVHNFRPGAANRIGLDYETLRAINHELVYLYAGSYGSKGPEAHRAAFHSTPNALSGGGILQAGAGNVPVDDSYPDPCAGLAVAASLAMGLLGRARFGIGQYLETTMLASAGYVHSNSLTLFDGALAPEVDGMQFGLGALNRLYQCSDGWIFLAVHRERERRALLTALMPGGDDGLTSDESALAETLERQFRTRTVREWEDELPAAGVPLVAASGRSFEEFFHRANDLVPGSHPSFGDYWLLPNRVAVAGVEPCEMEPSACGEQTRDVLHELGVTDADIARLEHEGVVHSASL